VAGIIGCSGGSSHSSSSAGGGGDGGGSGDEEAKVKSQFEKLKQALEKRDAEKIWALLDDKSQEDAEKAAKHIREEFAKADDKGKKELEKKYTFTGTDKEPGDKLGDLKLAELTGKTVLRTKQFHDKYDPMEDAEIEGKIDIQKDRATIPWKSKEGDKGNPGTNPLILRKQKGEWKAHLMTPR
jgi:hypothetical protein